MALGDKIDALKVVQNDDQVQVDRKREQRQHADGWDRGVQWDGESGAIFSGPVSAEPNASEWLDILGEFGLDPEVYMIPPDGRVNVRTWDANVGRDPKTGAICIERLRYYKADIVLRSRHTWITEAELQEHMKPWKPSKAKPVLGDPHAFVINVADWQLGKGGEGIEESGVESTVERIHTSMAAAVERMKEFKRLKINVETIVIMGLGDIIEGCSGHYPSQAYGVEINQRQQFRLAVRLFRDFVVAMSKLAPKIIVGSVGGNHGENRNGSGKAYTDPSDNLDAALIDMVSMALEDYQNVKFIPIERELSVTLDLYGTVVGWTHGHLARGGANAAAKQYNWFKGQAANKTPIGDAQVLVTGHYHSFCIVEHSQNFLWLQTPAMDSGSEWWINSTGETSTSGTLSFLIGPRCKMAADFIKLL